MGNKWLFQAATRADLEAKTRPHPAWLPALRQLYLAPALSSLLPFISAVLCTLAVFAIRVHILIHGNRSQGS